MIIRTYTANPAGTGCLSEWIITKTFLFLVFLFLLIPRLSKTQPVRSLAPGPSYHFVNGRWFNGTEFEEREFFTENGFLTSQKPAELDSVIDLAGTFVVPPYGEGHNHNITDEGPTSFDSMYVERGIFYVKNPNSLPRWSPPRGRVGMLNAVDAVFAKGGITATGGHPNGLVQRNIGYEIFREDDGDGGFVWIIDDSNDLNRKWELILSANPDFLKTYLLYSEEYEIRKNDTTYFNRKGLNPDILIRIVDRAHSRGLRVSTHIETAADFHHAVMAETDEINHMPGFRFIEEAPLDNYRITDADAKKAAESGIMVVTTLGGDNGDNKIRQLHIDNLRTLKKYGVAISIGSDQYRGNSLDEIRYLQSLGVFSRLELLKMWCETTPKAAFPNRRIGELRDGYKANFLVLDENPLEDFDHTQSITMRVKQGRIMEWPD